MQEKYTGEMMHCIINVGQNVKGVLKSTILFLKDVVNFNWQLHDRRQNICFICEKNNLRLNRRLLK